MSDLNRHVSMSRSKMIELTGYCWDTDPLHRSDCSTWTTTVVAIES